MTADVAFPFALGQVVQWLDLSSLAHFFYFKKGDCNLCHCNFIIELIDAWVACYCCSSPCKFLTVDGVIFKLSFIHFSFLAF